MFFLHSLYLISFLHIFHWFYIITLYKKSLNTLLTIKWENIHLTPSAIASRAYCPLIDSLDKLSRRMSKIKTIGPFIE